MSTASWTRSSGAPPLSHAPAVDQLATMLWQRIGLRRLRFCAGSCCSWRISTPTLLAMWPPSARATRGVPYPRLSLAVTHHRPRPLSSADTARDSACEWGARGRGGTGHICVIVWVADGSNDGGNAHAKAMAQMRASALRAACQGATADQPSTCTPHCTCANGPCARANDPCARAK